MFAPGALDLKPFTRFYKAVKTWMARDVETNPPTGDHNRQALDPGVRDRKALPILPDIVPTLHVEIKSAERRLYAHVGFVPVGRRSARKARLFRLATTLSRWPLEDRRGTLNELVNDPKRTSAVFAALADATRRRILLSLAGNDERPVAELARPFRISSPAISRHLRILERARLINRRREGRNHLIRANQSGLVLARQWLVQCEAGWNHSFDSLDRLLRNQHRKETKA